jgi:hypothetical protein
VKEFVLIEALVVSRRECCWESILLEQVTDRLALEDIAFAKEARDTRSQPGYEVAAAEQ